MSTYSENFLKQLEMLTKQLRKGRFAEFSSPDSRKMVEDGLYNIYKGKIPENELPYFMEKVQGLLDAFRIGVDPLDLEIARLRRKNVDLQTALEEPTDFASSSYREQMRRKKSEVIESQVEGIPTRDMPYEMRLRMEMESDISNRGMADVLGR